MIFALYDFNIVGRTAQDELRSVQTRFATSVDGNEEVVVARFDRKSQFYLVAERDGAGVEAV